MCIQGYVTIAAISDTQVFCYTYIVYILSTLALMYCIKGQTAAYGIVRQSDRDNAKDLPDSSTSETSEFPWRGRFIGCAL